jgi:DNA-binding beta-propeller fold protein YncE
MSTKTLILSFMFASLPFGGCQAPMTSPRTEEPAVLRPLVWPQSPQPARIRFVKTVTRPEDMGIESSFWQQLWGVLVGREEEWFIRPTGVAVNGQTILVTDAGGQALLVLNFQTKQFRKLQNAGSQRLISPVAVTLGAEERTYLVDSYLREIFIYDRKQNFVGAISAPTLQRPAGLAYDSARNRLYVADSAAHRIWIFTGDGKPLGEIGRRGDGDGEFNFPTHVALDKHGNLYVADALNFRMQMFDSEGRFTGKFGRHGDSSGNFASPKGLAVDSEDHIYVVDALFDAVQIFDRAGQYLLTFGERGVGPGQFWLPGGIFIDDRDQIYVADTYNQRVQIFQYLKESKK